MDNKQAINDKLFGIIRSVFAQPDLSVSEQTTAAEVAGWDSFNHMNLIMQVEEEFGITFETEEIGKMAKVSELIGAIRTKTAAQTL